MEDIEILSVWEVAHRWHDFDQDVTDAAKLPVPVKETMRELMFALKEYLNAYDALGEHIAVEYLGFGFKKTKFAKKLESDLNAGTFDKQFLKTTFVRRDELPKWFPHRGIPLPRFWYPEWEGADKQSGIREASEPSERDEASAQEVAGNTQKSVIEDSPKPSDKDKAKTQASAKARKAALIRHEPTRKLKDELYLFWDSGKCPSQAEAVRRFMKGRSDESLRPLSPTNAERTLKEALSKYVRSKRKP